MTHSSPNSVYSERESRFTRDVERLQRQFNTVAVARLGISGVGIVFLGIAAVTGDRFSGSVFAACVLLFIFLMRKHDRLATALHQASAMQTVNDRELRIANGTPSGYPDGSLFIDDDHPHANDLDLFGPHSLFAHINRSASIPGTETLAAWLKQPASAETVRNRQAAVAELASDLEWRQALQGAGLELPAASTTSPAIREWIDANELARFNVPVALMLLLPVLTVAAVALTVFTGMSALVPITLLIVNRIIITTSSARMNTCYAMSNRLAGTLTPCAAILATIERAQFSSPELVRLRGNLDNDTVPVSEHIRQLATIVDNLAIRHNQHIHFPLNTLLFWDLWWARRLNGWRQRNRDSIHQWFAAMGSVEALTSLATLAYNHPMWCTPTVLDGDHFALAATAIGHPLLKHDECVTNDFTIDAGNVAIITGANMAGKSTFQRAIGINIVLAGAGAPVCATTFTVRPVMLFTSMRTRDSLADNESTFYAELRRIRMVIDAAAEGHPLFFLLDELLRGTNADDRRVGATALVRQLLGHPAISGLVATHDLYLATLGDEEPRIQTYCFESTVDGDTLSFDYTLRPGVCRRMNATLLMQKMGIAIPSTTPESAQSATKCRPR